MLSWQCPASASRAVDSQVLLWFEVTLLPSSTAGLPEYIGMTLFLQSAAATFTAFDAQRSGRITLDFNQWWGSVLLATCYDHGGVL